MVKNGKKTLSGLRPLCVLTLCFLVPAVVLLIALAVFGMAPFGDRSTLIMDMSDQYVEFFCGLKQILRDGNLSSLFFSWGKAMGSNYVGVFAYYLSSPLSLLTLFVPNSAMPVGLLFLTVLKVGLCGLTMGIFLQHMGFKKHDTCIFFATAYALMSYNIVYSMCVMWLDGVIWLPLVLLGVEQVLRKNKMMLLIVSLLGIFISNYYIAYMVGLFAACWLVYRIAAVYWGWISWKMLLIRIGKFAMSAVTAAGLGAWLLLPTWYSLMQGKVGGNGVEASGVWNFKAETLLGKMFFGEYDSITNSGAPFLYCGIAIILLTVGYFVARKISVRERIASACMLAFLLISLASVQLDLAWHIFQYPNWFPYRYAFVVSFFMIYLAARCFQNLSSLGMGFGVAGMLLLVFGGLAASLMKDNTPAWQHVAGTVAVGLCYLLLFLLCKMLGERKLPFPRAVAGVLCCLLVTTGCYELYRNTSGLLKGLNGQFGYESYSAYGTYKDSVEEILSLIEADKKAANETDYAAVAPHYVRSINDPIGFGYRSISHYSSAYNRTSNSFFRSLGYAQSYFWSLHFGGTAISDSLFGVRYTVNNEDIQGWTNGGRMQIGSTMPDFQYDVIGTVEGAGTATVYRNPYAITAPFVVSKDLLTTKIEGDFLTAQNSLMNSVMGEDVNCLQVLDSSVIGVEDDTIQITMPSRGVLYVYFSRDTERVMTVNGTYSLNLFRNESDCIQSLGLYEAGETATVQVSGARDLVDNYWTKFAVLDMDKLESATTRLQAGAMQNFSAETGNLSGIVTCEEDCVLFTSIPYDEGWHVWVDGQEVETTTFGEALLCVELSAGDHFVRMEYSAKGAELGLAITVFTGVILVCICGVKFKKYYKLRQV